ncbi:CHAT domain-containing protein [Chlorogloeopsis sp. ULAP01]|uniref:CHAT domain-containing protein n=1 Tax=Chlorogloeopsis sp. ULAP01 TaxID=3056483 RepID=UPI0025AABC21|nr:CHAT domain-containing protein [Chlorogloeopsis sp. ULAP01]MDM9382761.1 CHAT domain-containing protein [Chlorogloeopsis sp. ULAP01]
MLGRYRTSSVRRLLKLLFLFFFTSSLCLVNLPLPHWQGRYELATAQLTLKSMSSHLSDVSVDASQLLEQGNQQYDRGNFQAAITNWEQAIAYYRRTNHWLNVGQILIKQAQAYNSLGKPEKAIILSESALQIARVCNDDSLEAAALGNRGEAYRLQGDYKQAIVDLKSSIKIAQVIDNSTHYNFAVNQLGSTYISLALLNYNRASSALEAGDNDEADVFTKQGWEYDLEALEYFNNSLNLARKKQDRLREIHILLNSIPPAFRIRKSNLAIAKLKLALQLLERLPNSRQKVYAAIELAHLIQFLPFKKTSFLNECPASQGEPQALELLTQAISISQSSHYQRALSFALGYLAHIYECRQNYQQALNITRQAQQAANTKLNAQDSLYLWEWQAGRILKAQHRLVEAIAAYEQAIATFNSIHNPIAINHPNLHINHNHTIEKIYRELIALRLNLEESEISQIGSINNPRYNLNSILNIIDALKIRELQKSFNQDSLFRTLGQTKLDLKINKNTAVIWSIIQDERTAIIVYLPNGEIKFKWIQLDSQSLKDEINKFRIGLEKRSDIIYNRGQAQRLYDLMIRAFEKDLESLHIKTLVFIPDGLFHSVPMGALHNGKQFLIQKYAITTSSSISLTPPLPTKPKKLRVLAVGLTKDAIVDNQKYQALINVKKEINQVLNIIPDGKQLLDENFTRDRLYAEIRQGIYPIIHIATHGEFSFIPEDTFLVTGDNDKLSVTDLYNMIHNTLSNHNSVDLLVLTACETARGGNSTNLGLASIAILAGVKSSLASLWAVNDAATVTLITNFYQNWHNLGLSKAEALQKAQQDLIALGKKYAHPYYWAPFIISGNWL